MNAQPDFKSIAAIAWSSPEGCAVLEEELRAIYYRGRADEEALSVQVTPFSDLQRAEAAEAKLAEREAELAKADAAQWATWQHAIGVPSRPMSNDERSWQMESIKRHAARQQPAADSILGDHSEQSL